MSQSQLRQKIQVANEEEIFLTARETASLLRVGTGQIYRWVNSGALLAARAGSKILISRAAIRRFIYRENQS